MKKIIDLSGKWEVDVEDLGNFEVFLPGTLDENKIGRNEAENIATRLTRRFSFEGVATYYKTIFIPEIEKKRLFLKIERSKEVTLLINEVLMVPWQEGTLSTAYLYELTEYTGKHVNVKIQVDNAYSKWPRESIIGSSASTDETQTNWNGILGEFAIYEEDCIFISSLRVYPNEEGANVSIEIEGMEYLKEEQKFLNVTITSEALEADRLEIQFPIQQKKPQNRTDNLRHQYNTTVYWKKDIQLWDEWEGVLYNLQAILSDPTSNQVLHQKEIVFGIRTFSIDKDIRLNLNNRKVFMRGEANCCVFPEKGYPPMTEVEWIKILNQYKEYGVNCMRFHSWCPPEAAFRAADQLGMMMQPELSQWNFKDAFGNESERSYYSLELKKIAEHLANHPSYVMLTFGNELQYTKEGFKYANELLKDIKCYDHSRLYAISSNYHYGEEGVDGDSDFYTAMTLKEEILRAISSPMIGHLNECYPSACHTYDHTVQKIRELGKPVFGFEVGQYEILPDFNEIDLFCGVTKAVNYELIRNRAKEMGMLSEWGQYVEATGESAYLCYKEEVEAVLRTEGMSGLSLLGLQDFPGQGTALVGMMNVHLDPKPFSFASPERFRQFFNQVVPLLYLKKYTYQNGEELSAILQIANYGKRPIHDIVLWSLIEGNQTILKGQIDNAPYVNQGLNMAGEIKFRLPKKTNSKTYQIQIQIGVYKNEYTIWSYEDEIVNTSNVQISEIVTEELLESVKNGATYYIEPETLKENFPNSITGHFTNDFWSIGTFPLQDGGMGLFIDTSHPALEKFPTQKHSDYQWWPMSKGRVMILPNGFQSIIKVPDSATRAYNMGLLFEINYGKGRLMISGMGLSKQQQYPECRALLGSILSYLDKEDVLEFQTMTKEELAQIVKISSDQGATFEKR